jgi:hypothetical protein
VACQFDRQIPKLASNLVALYATALPVDKVLGEQWYPKARAIVSQWAEHYGQSVETVACVVAALSPQNNWPTNLIQADDILANRPVSIGGIRANIDKAERILRDRAIRTIEYFPQGPKVASFAINLSGDDTAVTVDTHAMQAALANVQSTYTLKWQPYICFATAYEIAANRVGRLSAEFQAIIWHTWKRVHPPQAKRNARQQWSVVGEY